MRLRVEDRDNPEAIRLKKYATGAHLLLETEPVRTGTTPRVTNWTKNKAKLYRYEPEKPKRHPVPVLLVAAPILRPYVLDLIPNNSFVEFLVNEGFDVYLLDWGVPGDEDREMSFEHYVLDYLPRAVRKVLRASEADALSLFGYHMGGTLSAMYASLFPEHLENLVLLAAPVGFATKEAGLFEPFIGEGSFDPDPVVEAFGNVPATRSFWTESRLPEAADGSAERARPHLPREAFTGSFLAVSEWVDDEVPLPGEAFRQWVIDLHRHDRLARGELELRGRRVDLSNIDVPLLNIAGKGDRISPLSQTEAIMSLVGSRDGQFVALEAGHVGLMAGRVAREELWPRVRDWLAQRSTR